MRDLRSAASRLHRVILAAATFIPLGTFLMATPAQAPPPAGNLKIQNLNSLLCLTPAGGSTANNTLVSSTTATASRPRESPAQSRPDVAVKGSAELTRFRLSTHPGVAKQTQDWRLS
jgi:hypothetical protein